MASGPNLLMNKKGSEGGRREAIRDLVRDGQPLDGTNLDQAYLVNGYFKGASLQRASFRGANLADADFSCASGFSFMIHSIPRWDSCLHTTMIAFVDFSNAILSGANFSNADIFASTFVDTGPILYANPITFDNAAISSTTFRKVIPMRFEHEKLSVVTFKDSLPPSLNL
jgi:uncharacterized protein YjbI with pentapeptide repeats